MLHFFTILWTIFFFFQGLLLPKCGVLFAHNKNRPECNRIFLANTFCFCLVEYSINSNIQSIPFLLPLSSSLTVIEWRPPKCVYGQPASCSSWPSYSFLLPLLLCPCEWAGWSVQLWANPWTQNSLPKSILHLKSFWRSFGRTIAHPHGFPRNIGACPAAPWPPGRTTWACSPSSACRRHPRPRCASGWRSTRRVREGTDSWSICQDKWENLFIFFYVSFFK